MPFTLADLALSAFVAIILVTFVLLLWDLTLRNRGFTRRRSS